MARLCTLLVLGRYEATVRGWLVVERDAPRKQRHTARRVWQRLIEDGAQVAESSVRAMVTALKAEVGLNRRQVAVPLLGPTRLHDGATDRQRAARRDDAGPAVT
jgi:hypothetical protein